MKEIKINNFQSHEKAEIELHSGITTLIGSSNSGKTAFIRALLWVIRNRPLGTSFISHWADGSDVQIDNVRRIKNDSYNGYKIDGKELETGREVPPEIKKLFNLEEVNIQEQMDAPFLLSQSSGEVARFFNKTIRLDIIDKFLSSISQKKKTNTFAIKTTEKDIKEYKRQYKDLRWLDDAKKIIYEYENEKIKKEEIENEIIELKDGIDLYNRYERQIKELNYIEKVEKYIKKIQKTIQEKEKIKEKTLKLYVSIEEFEKNKKYCEDIGYISGIEKRVNKLLSLLRKRKEIKISVKKLKLTIEDYTDNKDNVKSYEKMIKEYKEKLPDVCPLCGGKGKIK